MFINRKAFITVVLAVLLGEYAFSQVPAGDTGAGAGTDAISLIRSGVDLYGQGRWAEAAAVLRQAAAGGSAGAGRSEALFWLSLSELAQGDYEGALRDMEDLEKSDPESRRIGELGYHKGRAMFFLGRFDEAAVLLKNYADSIPETTEPLPPQEAAKKSAALYWIGESLYSLGLLDKAEEVFLLIVEAYPQSAKYEAASYRLALINQKKVEAELLGLLKWSHEESLKTMEEYERRERSYDQALIAYQKRIADMLKDTRLADLENSNAQYREQLMAAEERIKVLEESLGQTPAASSRSSASPSIERLQSLKAAAMEARDQLIKDLNK
jgi:TolA-binding protein